jgi:single-strand DNA-binding protein
MSSYNRVILMGNLARDPEVRQAQNGTFVAKTGLAVNERLPDGQGGWKEEASFINIVLFGKRAEAFGKYMQKGKPVLIEGRLRESKWQDKESGQNRSRIEVIVDDWQFVGSREGGGGARSEAPAAAAQPAPEFPGAADFAADDVPF